MLPDPPSITDLRTPGIEDDEYAEITPETVLWRVHRTTSPHSLPWHALRTYGPVLRFDPHPYPRGERPRHGVWYGATDVSGALAEAFAGDRVIDRHRDAPYLTGSRATRTLCLLDLGAFGSGRWPTRVGDNVAMTTAPHGTVQRWARVIRAAHPGLDGVLCRGRFAGNGCLALFTPAADAFPVCPLTSNPLSHPRIHSRLAGAAVRIGHTVV